MGLVVNDIIAVTFKGEYDGQQIRNTFHYRCLTPGSSATAESDLLAVANDFASSVVNPLTSKMLDCQVSTMNWNGVTAQRVYPTRSIGMTHAAVFHGPVGGDGMPANSAIVLTKRTTTAGRMGTGSLHMTAIPSMWIVKSENSNMAPYQALADQMLPQYTVTAVTLTLDPGLFNPSRPPTFFSKLFDVFPNKEVRTMRRRTVGRGI